jgi:hypothetical protein
MEAPSPLAKMAALVPQPAERTRSPAPPSTLARPAPASLRLPLSMSYGDWASAGRQLARLSHGVAWALGDWLLYGQAHFRSRYRDALAATGLDYQTLRNYAWVARNVPPSRRRDKLSFQHHAEVASLSEAEQELWLGRAERLRWSRNQLRHELADHRCALDAASDRPVVLRIALPARQEARWRRAARASGQELEEWLAAVADLAADRAPTIRP